MIQNGSFPTHLPENYHEVLYWKLSQHKSLVATLNIVGLLLMGLAFVPLCAWVRLWRPAIATLKIQGPEVFVMLFGIALTIVAHELTHGLALRSYGARPRYGVMWQEMMFYATAPGYAFRRNAYIVIALAPLVGLSVAALALLMLPLPEWLMLTVVFCSALNVGSAIGDMWLVRVALGYPKWAYIVDEKDGLRVFMPLEQVS